MLRNYLKIALRNFRQHKFISFINLVGLSLGIATAIFAFLFIHDEFRTDRFHRNVDRIYQVVLEEKNSANGEVNITEVQPYPLGPALLDDLPEVESFVRFIRRDRYVKLDNQAVMESILFADSSLFSVFSFPILYGDSTHSLQKPTSVAISESKAIQLFGNNNPIGKYISVRLSKEYQEFEITAVFKDIPGYSTIQADIVLPMHESVIKIINRNIALEDNSPWYDSSFKTFVLLRGSASVDNLIEKLADLRKQYFPDEITFLEDFKGEDTKYYRTKYQLWSFSNLYFQASTLVSGKQGGNPLYSYILAMIAGGILLMACFNYLTLSIGRASHRTQEIGIRKIVGARRLQIAFQFTTEALILSLLSLGLALVIVALVLPIFNDLADKTVSLSAVFESKTLLIVLSIALISGLLSGIYPAIYLSSISTLVAFSKKLSLGRVNLFTQTLVTFQFCLPIIFMVATLVMIYQLHYMRTKDLGLNSEHVLVIENDTKNSNQTWEQFRNLADRQTGIISVAATNSPFVKYRVRYGYDNKPNEMVYASAFHVSHSFLETTGISLAKGRWFNPSLASDSTEAIVINEEFVRTLGLREPIGKSIDSYYVIGVVKDFHIQSLSAPITPAAFYLSQDSRNKPFILAKLSSDNLSKTLSDIQTLWRTQISDSPFAYSFLDEDFNALYQQEEHWRKIMQWVATITVIIAVLGLIGLTALAAAGREKEIGIRKVLGASLSSILVLLSQDFFRLIFIAFIIAIPIANYAVTEWLAEFAYRVDVKWWVFAIPACLILLVAILSVSQQTIKAATRNPVDSLRNE